MTTDLSARDTAARGLEFYRLAADCAVEGWLSVFAVGTLIAERGNSPVDDPSRAWSDDDLEGIVRRTYATHRRRTESPGTDHEDETAAAS